MSDTTTRRRAVFSIVSALGTMAIPTLAQSKSSGIKNIGYDRIWIKNTNGDELSIIHWNGEGYEPGAVKMLSWLFRDWRDNDSAVYIDPRLFSYLANIQTRLSMMASQPCRVMLNSGYRTVRRNATIEGAAQNSYHCKGKAADITVSGFKPSEVHRLASLLNVHGLGSYPSFTHVDVGQAGRRW